LQDRKDNRREAAQALGIVNGPGRRGMSVLGEAFLPAAEGRRLVLLHPGSKRPIGNGWQNAGTPDYAAIHAAVRANPGAGLGVLGGAGLAIVDVDRDKDGFGTFARLESDHGVLPATRTVQSGGGGRHYWFATEGDEPSWNPGPGLEVRASGRQTVCPPTIHPNGNAYVWLDRRADLAPLPQRLSRPAPPAPAMPARPRDGLRDPVREIPPPEYVRVLLGVTPNRDGKIACPFHDDTHPSFHVYASAEQGWFCFQCLQGGTVIDLAARLAGVPIPIRGRDFLGVLDYLRRRFG
jgi:hypothetical protein